MQVITKGMKETEDQLQEKCENWLEIQRIEFVHIPDTMYKFLYSPLINHLISRDRKVYGWLMGVRKLVSKYLLGLPDLILFDKGGKYLAVELKTKTGKVRQGQKNRAKRMPIVVCRSLNEFTETVNKWSDGL